MKSVTFTLGRYPLTFPHFYSCTRLASNSTTLEWLERFKNHERSGIPPRAGTDASPSSPFDLGRMHRLLADLDNPHKNSWKAVHIAGTKGKGSTATMMSEILSGLGFSTGLYTSPHVLSLNERIRVNGESIAPTAFDQLVQRYGPRIEEGQQREGGKLTHFEVLTALAYRHFADYNVDVGVIETGVGGTSDATNVLSSPSLAVSVITAIGNDHAAALGGSLESIAAAKLGIVKPDVPLVVSRQPDPVVSRIVDQHVQKLNPSLVWKVAEEVEVKAVEIGESGEVDRDGEIVVQRVTFGVSDRVKRALRMNDDALDVCMRLVGKHQTDNAATAIVATAATAATFCLDSMELPETAIKHGLQRAWLPGRFDIRTLPAREGSHICVLDGSHTSESAAVLAETVRRLYPLSNQWTVSIVLAMAMDKDIHGICSELSKIRPNAVIFSQVAVGGGSARSAAPGMLMAAWQGAARGHRCRLMIKASMSAAISAAAREVPSGAASQNGGKKGIVLITGSLHAVGAALKETDFFLHPNPQSAPKMV